MAQDSKSDITIVGGGFAGLAAALCLHRAGAKIRIIEKRPFFGGRAYSFKEPRTGQVVDNGQHLMMGAYHETLEFLRDLGTLQLLEIQKGLEVSFAEGPGKFTTLRCPRLPAPLHVAIGLFRFKGLKFRDKRGMARLIQFCQKTQGNGASLDDLSVSQLFEKTLQTTDAVRKFWEPLGLAVLNEPMNQASAKLFLEVLRQGLLHKSSDSNLIIPRVGFSELYADPAKNFFEKNQVPISFQTQVTHIANRNHRWSVHTDAGEIFESDFLLLAVPPNALQKILVGSDPDFLPRFGALERFQPSPIVSINLWYQDFHPKEKFVGLTDSPIHWVFNKSKVYEGKRGEYLSLVVSGAYALAEQNKDTLVELAVREIQRIYPQLQGRNPEHGQVIKEYEATYSGRLGLERDRPSPKTALPGLFLAGDWTHTGLPATIESAVLSGHRAAREILEETR